MTYVRPSSLGVAEFCPRSADLNEQSGISRTAIISTAWHAKLAGNDTLVGELHPDERKEVATYGAPTDARVPSSPAPNWCECEEFGQHVAVPCAKDCPTVRARLEREAIVLDYESAEKELHVELYERDDLITKGTLDFAWVLDVGGQRWAFVADLKRSTWAIPDGPDCLQLAAYGHAYAAKRGCVGYTPGLWSGTDSDWSWGTPVDLTSPEALDLWLRIKRSSRNDWRLKIKDDDKRFVTGSHCKACYGRIRCPEWADLAEHASNTDTQEITNETAGYILLAAQALEERAERLKENIKAFADRGGVVRDNTSGKVYLPTLSAGRKSLDQDALKAAGIDVAKFQKVGKPFSTYGWRKA